MSVVVVQDLEGKLIVVTTYDMVLEDFKASELDQLEVPRDHRELADRPLLDPSSTKLRGLFTRGFNHVVIDEGIALVSWCVCAFVRLNSSQQYDLVHISSASHVDVSFPSRQVTRSATRIPRCFWLCCICAAIGACSCLARRCKIDSAISVLPLPFWVSRRKRPRRGGMVRPESSWMNFARNIICGAPRSSPAVFFLCPGLAVFVLACACQF